MSHRDRFWILIYFFYDFNISFGLILIYYGKYINPGFFVVIKENYLCIGGPMSVCSRISLELKIVFLYRCCSRNLQFLSTVLELAFLITVFGIYEIFDALLFGRVYHRTCITIYIYTLQRYTIRFKLYCNSTPSKFGQ